MEGVRHASCNAHHLRELKALIVIEKEPWATDMKAVLLKAKILADNRTDDLTVDADVVGELLQRYDEILTQAV
jgi:transposase